MARLLPKMAAILTAAATLVGGSITASTAFADDLSTQSNVTIQQDNDTSGQQDNSENNTTGSDDAIPQADTSPQGNTAAPDVTIHDMLDTDSAYVSKLKLTDRVTGTAPFDNDNERGDDKDASNDIVRSFDDVIYNYDYTVTPDSTMDYYKRTRVGFRFELPYPADKVTFDTDQMGWVDQTPGFQPKLTTETINGVSTQVYTCYRLLEPTSNSPTVNPGTSAISLAVAVKGAPHGYKFHPTVKAWTAWDASNPTNLGAHKQAVDTPGDVTVSAKLNLNVRMNQGIVASSQNTTWDFGKAEGYANSELGKQKGMLTSYSFAIDTRWKDRTKGLRGIELPTGDISFDFHISDAYREDGNGNTVHAKEAALQPYFWDMSDILRPSRYTSNPGRSTEDKWVPRDDNYDYAVGRDSYGNGQSISWKQRTAGNGTYTVTQKRDKDGSTFHVTLSDYKIDPDKFPISPWTRSQSSLMNGGCVPGRFKDATCKQMEIGEISVGTFMFFNPTIINGKGVAEYYGHDVTLLSDATDTSLSAVSSTGDRLADSASNDNQTVTNDDSRSISSILRLPGSFIQDILYGCETRINRWGTSCGEWFTQDTFHGTDSLTQGSTATLQSGFSYTLGTSDLPVMALNLVKWDPSVFDSKTATLRPGGNGRYRYQMGERASDLPPIAKYAVKHDGKTWTSDSEQKKAGFDDLDYYDSYNEAAKHGVVVGMLLGGRDAAYAQTGGTDKNAHYESARIFIKVRDDAKVGSVAQLTGVAATWTRSQLVKAGLATLDPDEASDDEWRAWAAEQDPWRIYKTVKPKWNYGGESYIKAKYDTEGNYQGGDTGGYNRGDSLLVVGENPKIGKTVAQKDPTGQAKTIYDLDKEQRYADWDLAVKAETNINSTGASYNATDLYVTDTLPKGLTYMDGSAYLDGAYKEVNGGQEQGVVTGGTAITPTVIKNDDGTTTLKMTVAGVPADGSMHHIHLTTRIGDASDPDNDAKNNQQYTNHVEITSKRNGAKPDKDKGTIAEATIRVSRTHSSALATRADPLINDIERPLGYSNMLANFSRDVKENPYAVDIMPYAGSGSKSKYSGSYTMTGLSVSAKNGASLDSARVWFTTDPQYRSMDASKITRSQVMKWTEATVDRKTGTVTIPDGCEKPVAWAFTSDKLPANARYDFSLAFKPTGNKAADAYVNRWTDGDNKVDAVTQVVERKVNGVAWFDYNHDGKRQDTDMLLKGVHVALVDKAGTVVTSMNGSKCETVTDANGHYELTGIPAGSGYKLRFTPADNTSWAKFKVTLKKAKDASEATNSDTDAENNTDGTLKAGVISLKDFPKTADMTTVMYEDPNEDHGITGTLAPAAPVSFEAAKQLKGRPNGAWLTSDKYVADVTPVGDAPKSALPETITFDSNKVQTVRVNAGEFPHSGTYQYQVKERKGANPGVTYDGHVYTVTITVTDSNTSLSRRVSVALTCDGQTMNLVQFTNSYTAADASIALQTVKEFTNAKTAKVKVSDFQFQLHDSKGNVLQTVNAAEDGQVRFNPIRYTQAELAGAKSKTYEYSITEVNNHLGGVKYDTKTVQQRVTVTDDGSGQLKTSLIIPAITPDNPNADRFVNSYYAQPAKVTFHVSKTINNPQNTLRHAKAGEFQFQLQDANGKVLQTVSNDADGNAAFNPVSYDNTGEHDYRIVEVKGAAKGITYDTTTHKVHVSVVDDGLGNLKATTTVDGQTGANAVFRNTYDPTPVSFTLHASKKLTGSKSNTKVSDFTFSLYDNLDCKGQPLQTVHADGQGNIKFQPVTVTAKQLNGMPARTFDYAIRENNTGQSGITFDSHTAYWHVRVSDDLSGTLKAVPSEDKYHPIQFTNDYQAKNAAIRLQARKQLKDPQQTGRVLHDGEFKFTLSDDDTHTTVGEYENDRNGNITSDTIVYSKPGIHHYTWRENEGKLGGISYDKSQHKATVTVTDDGNGQLHATVDYDGKGDQTPMFTNTYTVKPASDTLNAVKTVTATEGNHYTLQGGDFHFTLQETGRPNDAQANQRQTVANGKDGSIRFQPLTFTRTGAYTYTLAEDPVNVKGVTKDPSVYTITYKVEDPNHMGQLKVASKTIQRDGKTVPKISFDNKYATGKVGYTIQGVKTITNTDDTSRQPKDGEFKFTLTGDNGAPMPQGSDGQSKTVSNIGGAFTFGQITYDRPGEYTYHVSEQAGKDKTITYDTRTYDVTVTVTDDGGYLTATSNMDGQTISFDNTYTPSPAETSFDVRKLMRGRAFKSGEFTVLLKDEQDNILQSKQIEADGKQDENGAYTGEAHFDPITYAKTGLYHYTIVEQAGSEKNGVTYDGTVHNVTVLVEEDAEQHKLVAKTNYIAVSPSDKSGQPGVLEKTVTFRNSYKPEGTGFVPCASKKLNGASLKDGEYEFELVDTESGKTLQSARNTSDGAVTFQPVSYTDVGEHDYVIREKVGLDPHVEYDRTEHKIHVKVTDDMEGHLQTAVAYDGGEEPPTFVNTYTPDKLSSTGSAMVGIAAVTVLLSGGALLLLALRNRRRRPFEGAHVG